MAIKKTYSPANRSMNRPMNRRPVTASSRITAGVTSRQNQRAAAPSKNLFRGLTPAQQAFASQIMANSRKKGASIMGATNTSNIAARPDFLEFLPMFVQKLILLDVFGSVAMKSRQQLIPYFKFVAENTKGETKKGTILNSPFVNRQGIDPNFTGQVVKNEIVDNAAGSFTTGTLAFLPVLPGSVTVSTILSGVTTAYTDDGAGNIVDGTGASAGTIDYASGTITFSSAKVLTAGDSVNATYQYDNQTVGPDANGNYGAAMGKGYLTLDEINMVAEVHQLESVWSVYSAFAAQQEYGANIADMSKEAAFGELTAEINSLGFAELKKAATYSPQYNWDAAPIKGGVFPSDYLNMFKLKLGQAASAIYQKTRLSQPNYVVGGTNFAAYVKMINGFNAASMEDAIGPYKVGQLDQFAVYCDPNYDANEWVMGCKSADIRRNSALFGEYMPFTETQPIGLGDASVQQGYGSMFAMKVVNPDSIVGGRIIGTF